MAETTIEWADYTFNPWVGCQRVSPGCVHCYAEAYDKRVGGVPVSQRPSVDSPSILRWGPTAPRTRTSPSYWKQPLKWDREAAAGERRKVFCASLADVFEDRAELIAWREDLFGLIARTPNLDWLLLTKRPENIAHLWPEAMSREPGDGAGLNCVGPDACAWSNIWLGTTVEDQQRADERIPHLLSVPAAVRFLSCEPLLESVNLLPWLLDVAGRRPIAPTPGIDWVIIGGESGAGARRFEAAWARGIINQCRRARAKPFVKQLGAFVVDRNDVGFEAEHDVWAEGPDAGQQTRSGAWPTPRGIEEDINGYREEYQGADVRVRLVDRAGSDPAEWPLDLRVREFPKTEAA